MPQLVKHDVPGVHRASRSQPLLGSPSQSAKSTSHVSMAHALVRHTELARGRLHRLSQPPQWRGSLLRSKQLPPHGEVGAAQTPGPVSGRPASNPGPSPPSTRRSAPESTRPPSRPPSWPARGPPPGGFVAHAASRSVMDARRMVRMVVDAGSRRRRARARRRSRRGPAYSLPSMPVATGPPHAVELQLRTHLEHVRHGGHLSCVWQSVERHPMPALWQLVSPRRVVRRPRLKAKTSPTGRPSARLASNEQDRLARAGGDVARRRTAAVRVRRAGLEAAAGDALKPVGA